MRERYLWGVFVALLAVLPLFQNFALGTGKFRSIEESRWLLNTHYFTYIQNGEFTHADWKAETALNEPPLSKYFFGGLLAMHDIHLRDDSLMKWREEATAHNVSPGTFYGVLFKTISPGVFLNLRTFMFFISCLNLLLLYLLFRQITTVGVASTAIVFAAWLPQFSFTSGLITPEPLAFFLFLLGLHLLMQWQGLLISRQYIKAWLTTVIVGAMMGFGFGTLYSISFPLIIILAAFALRLEYRQTIFSLASLMTQTILMLAAFVATVFLVTPSLWTEPFVSLSLWWNNLEQMIATTRLINGAALSPSIFSWIELCRSFVQLPSPTPTLIPRQELFSLFVLFAALVFVVLKVRQKKTTLSSPLESELRVYKNTIFMSACMWTLFSIGAFLLLIKPESLYFFWPWLSLAAAFGSNHFYEKLKTKQLGEMKAPLTYALIFCLNVALASQSPWFSEVKDALENNEARQQIAYLQNVANRSEHPEAYWSRIAFINMQERNRLQARIYSLKTLSSHPKDLSARWILKHLHEKELQL